MSGSVIAGKIARGYTKAGVKAGAGAALTVTITRAGAPSGPVFAPIPGTPTTHSFVALPVTVEQAQRAGMTLTTGERVYSLVNHNVAIEPTPADELLIGGETFSIVEVIADDPAGFVLTWMVKVAGPVG